MCRFAFYLGPSVPISTLVTEPTNSIIHQSVHSRAHNERLNGDGFGIAWYVPKRKEPALFKDLMPAWSNLNLTNLAEVTETACLLAHVRAATPGSPVHRMNCHPFNWGALSFMHNGYIPEFQRLRRPIINAMSDEAFAAVGGTTDSEHLFGLVIDAYRRARGDDGLTGLPALAQALRQAIAHLEDLREQADIGEPSLLNLVLSDGKQAVASRFVSPGQTNKLLAKTLYVCSGARYRCVDGACSMLPDAGESRAVIVASEPLSDDESWAPVAVNSLVCVSADRSVRVEKL